MNKVRRFQKRYINTSKPDKECDEEYYEEDGYDE